MKASRIASASMLIAAVGLVLAAAPPADDPVPGHVPEVWPAPNAVLQSGVLSFTGHSTLGDFVGTTTAVSGALTGSADLANARGWVTAPVGTLVTGNGHRDRDLRATMDVAHYPTMRFELAGVAVQPSARGDTVTSALNGALTIHGVTRNVAIPATLIASADTVEARGGFPLDLADYDIDGLTRLFGTLRMKRHIEVRFHLRFQATPRQTRVDFLTREDCALPRIGRDQLLSSVPSSPEVVCGRC